MQNPWKKVSLIVAALLVIVLSAGGVLWSQVEPTATKLQATKAQLGSTQAEFEAAKNQLDMTKLQLDNTLAQLNINEEELNQMRSRYTYFREQISTRLGQGPVLQKYITPTDPTVAAIVQEIIGGDSQYREDWWKSSERIYHWLVNNIEYSVDNYLPLLPEHMEEDLTWRRDFWRLPVETLEDGAGDCEDVSTLLASMLLNYSEGRFATWIVGIKNEYRSHIAVAFPAEGELLAVLDPSGKYYTWHYSWSELRAYDVRIAVEAWLEDWAEEMPGGEVYVVFSDTFYRPISSTDEFIQWVRDF